MQSDKIKNTEEKAEKTEVCEVTSEYKKQRFGLKIFPETLEIVDTLFKHDNCKSRSEFIEKAVRFYCGYLLNKEHTATEFIAPQLTAMAEGIVKGVVKKTALKESRFPAFGKSRLFFMPDRKNNYFG